jgi:hypothetical protein
VSPSLFNIVMKDQDSAIVKTEKKDLCLDSNKRSKTNFVWNL